jgi:hypothetical protein
MRVTVAAEPPNPNLHSFVGKAVLEVRPANRRLEKCSRPDRQELCMYFLSVPTQGHRPTRPALMDVSSAGSVIQERKGHAADHSERR